MSDVSTEEVPKIYAVTVNCNAIPKGELLRSYYAEHYEFMSRNGKLSKVAYELGKQGRCHLHATWETSLSDGERHRGLYRKGYFYECKLAKSVAAWNTYIGKDRPKKPSKTCLIAVRLV